MFIRVDFPLPLAPMMAVYSPRPMDRSIPRRAVTSTEVPGLR